MLENNNKKVITRMAKRSLKSNRRKNLIIGVAILLSAFMLFTILTVGSTFFEMQDIQNLRMQGDDSDAYIYGGFTKEQKEQCEKNPDISVVGVSGIAGWAEKTKADDTLNTAFIWADETQWNILKKPAMEWMEGSYPQAENELMVTKAALEDCGLGNLNVGDSFTITYGDHLGSHTKEFAISGMWGGYGDQKIFYVSEAFFKQSGFSLEDYGRGFLWLKFASPIVTEETQQEFEDSLELGKKQRLLFTADSAQSVQILAGMAGLVLITCLSAYLLIYNILYLSVSGNIRYYGLLQTVGMTGRQVRHLMQKQMLLLGAIGIGLGVLLGMATSFFLIPVSVKALGIQQNDVQIAFHPGIFFLSILITGVTIYIGNRKPTKMATEVSPIEALGYSSISEKQKAHKMRRGKLIGRMAREQLSKDKKKTVVVVLSLATALSVFLCLITLIESQGARTFASSHMDSDMVILDDTTKKEEQSAWKRILDTELLSEITDNEAIKELHPVMSEHIIVPWEPDFAELWMKKFYEVWMNISYEGDVKAEYQQHPEKFYSFFTGIDQAEFEALNDTLENPVDEQAFINGETCILYRNNLELNMTQLKGKRVTCALYDKPQVPYSFEIVALTDDSYYASLNGIPPTVIVSDSFLKSIVEDPYISKVSLQYEEEYNQIAETAMKKIMAESAYAKDFSYSSKIKLMEIVEKAQGNLMGVGMGIILILALIGILNYVNTVTGNIQSRQLELAVMESVGMTEKQVRKMLVWEGLLFAGYSLFLTATVGLGITYIIYQSMNYMGTPFSIPVLPIVGMILFVVAVCVFVPLIAYRVLVGKKAIVERIRGTQ